MVDQPNPSPSLGPCYIASRIYDSGTYCRSMHDANQFAKAGPQALYTLSICETRSFIQPRVINDLGSPIGVHMHALHSWQTPAAPQC